jgi:hypothetical protein
MIFVLLPSYNLPYFCKFVLGASADAPLSEIDAPVDAPMSWNLKWLFLRYLPVRFSIWLHILCYLVMHYNRRFHNFFPILEGRLSVMHLGKSRLSAVIEKSQVCQVAHSCPMTQKRYLPKDQHRDSAYLVWENYYHMTSQWVSRGYFHMSWIS